MSALLVLTGANGRTGRAILTSLVRVGIPVRALVRKAEQAEQLRELGAVECSIGDLTDPDSIKDLMRGAGKVLHIGPPMHADEYSITTSLVDLARETGIDHFIYYSVLHPQIREIRHHRLKLDCEEYIINSGLAYTIVQPCRYMQHLEPIWPRIVSEGIHAMPFSTERRFSLVDLADVADACAIISADDAFRYGIYELSGPEALSQEDMAQIIGDVIGRPVSARSVPWEEMRQHALSRGAGEERVAQMEIMNRHYDAHGFQSNPQILQFVLGRSATCFRDYVQRLARAGGSAA